MAKTAPRSWEEAKVVVRPLRVEDWDAVVELHRKCFPDIPPWTRDQFASQINTFPDGQIGVDLEGKLVATSSSLIVDAEELGSRHTFTAACDGGFIRNHDPEGDSLYGIDIAVDPAHRGMRLARRIYDRRKELVRELNLRRILIVGRMPRYHRKAKEMPAEEYVRRVISRELRDPVINAQLANGFTVRSVIKNYLPSDRESLGCGVFMEWLNPHYAPERHRQLLTGSVRVAAVQYQMRTINSFEDFAKQCEFFIDTAGEYHSDFLLFPELLTTQLLALVPAENPIRAARRLDEFTTLYLEFFSSAAVRYNVNIIGGSHLTLEDDRLYNIAYLFRRDGSVAKQYKVHITPSEARWWGVSPGERLEIHDTDRGKIAILICYDSEFPELGRVAASQGAQLFFVPFNTDIRTSYLRVRLCSHARAVENGVYCVLSGAVGNLPFVEGADIHYAQSCILTPSDIPFSRDGVGAEATPNVETMLVHDLDLGLARRTRRTGTVRTWLDRRTDIYRVHYREPGRDGGEMI